MHEHTHRKCRDKREKGRQKNTERKFSLIFFKKCSKIFLNFFDKNKSEHALAIGAAIYFFKYFEE